MNREQLQHVLRAASQIVPGYPPIVIGSQAVLGSIDETELPIEATRSIEADIAFLDDPDEEKADAIDGAIGELSMFHKTFGFYGQGVSLQVATLPAGWEDRLRQLEIEGESAIAYCLEAHDCVVSKLVANRQKDREFGAALIQAGLIDPAVLSERVAILPERVADAQRTLIVAWIAVQVPPR